MKSSNRVRLRHAGWLIALISLAGTATAGEKSTLASPIDALPADYGVQVQNLYKHLAPQRDMRGGGLCGNSLLDAGEECDDGNIAAGDGCSATCLIEAGADCTLPVPPETPVVNGSFENGLVPWATAFGAGGNPFLLADLTNPFGDIGQVGEFYIIIFGSGGVADVSTIEQTSITIPTTATTLSWEFFGASQSDVGCDADPLDGFVADNAVFRAKIDGTVIFDSSATAANECDLSGPLWAFPQAILIDGTGAAPDFADGGTHTLTFEREILAATPNNTNFFVDDVQIDAIVVPPVPSSCFNGVCGDSILSSGEACDDGNTTAGDGCAADCTVEEDTHACGGGTTALECLTGGDCATATLATSDDIADGGLEGGSPNDDWTEGGSCPGCVIEGFEPICSEAFCGTDRARDGAWFAWFGGIAFDPSAAGPNIGTLSQVVTISSSATDLTFDLDTQCSGDPADTLVVDIDGTTIGTISCTTSLPGYTPQSFPLGAFADGAAHTVTFTGTNLCSNFVTDPTCQSNFFVDNIAIEYAASRPADPSVCVELDGICGLVRGPGFGGIEKFEAGIPSGWATFQLGTIPSGTNNWTTTDDTDYADADGSGCGGVDANWPGGSTLVEASGEAACADSDGSVEANGPDVEPDGFPDCGTAIPDDPTSDCQQRAYLCTPIIDPFAITNGTLSFNVDYQTASQDSSDPDTDPEPFEALEILVGTAVPNVFTIAGYESGGFIFDHKSVSLDVTDERVLSLNLNAFIDPALTDPDPPLTDPYYVCFHYAGVFSWYAQIDNVALRAENCAVGDTDFDGVSDDVDNCTLIPNPDQADANGDGIGNLCDPDVTGPGLADDDCVVNFPDLQAFKDGFFGFDPELNLDGEANVNFADLQIVKDFFFGAPGPSATGCN